MLPFLCSTSPRCKEVGQRRDKIISKKWFSVSAAGAVLWTQGTESLPLTAFFIS